MCEKLIECTDHAEQYCPDDNRFDLRPFLYPNWFGFKAIEKKLAAMGESGTKVADVEDKKSLWCTKSWGHPRVEITYHMKIWRAIWQSHTYTSQIRDIRLVWYLISCYLRPPQYKWILVCLLMYLDSPHVNISVEDYSNSPTKMRSFLYI